MRGLIYVLLILSMVFQASQSFAQIDTVFNRIPIDYAKFLSLVGQNNLAYAAQKFNMNIAEANIESAKIFPDPSLGFGWFDNGNNRMGMGYGFNSRLDRTIELGGKRKARINLANSEAELTKYLLLDYFRNLRADATINFLAALENKFQLNVKVRSYLAVNRLSNSDSIRFKLGSIKDIDARQSKVEAGSILNEVFQSLSMWKMSLVNLGLIVSKPNSDSLYFPIGRMNKFDREFNLNQLITEAQNNRADVLAALQNTQVAKKMVQLAKANRVADLGIGVGLGYASYDYNIVAPTPSFTQVSAGISIPLRFSNKYAGQLKMAHYAGLQAELLYKQVEVQIQVEVTQAYYNYITVRQQVNEFNNGLLTEAKKVRDGKIYSYQRGATSLLEVLNAQRTYNDIQQKYYETIYNYATALVQLERAAGIWDIDF